MRNTPRVFSSSSSSSSSLSSTSRIRAMEQVWRDHTFSPPPPPPHPTISPQQQQQQNPNHNNDDNDHVIVQDFFGLDHSSKNTSHYDLNEVPNLAPPPTSPSLNPGGFVASNNDIISGPNYVPSAAYNFSDVVVNNGIFSSCPTYIMNTRMMVESCGGGGGDRRHKRMMKNRESAARSRARKQAYTNELELEVAHLAAENERLKKQYEELSLAMAAQHSTKKTLQRTLTAPF